jgi:hypothetical protein
MTNSALGKNENAKPARISTANFTSMRVLIGISFSSYAVCAATPKHSARRDLIAVLNSEVTYASRLLLLAAAVPASPSAFPPSAAPVGIARHESIVQALINDEHMVANSEHLLAKVVEGPRDFLEPQKARLHRHEVSPGAPYSGAL